MKKITLVLGLCVFFFTALGQQTNEQFSVPVNYLLYLPQEYKADTALKWPLMVFLHGSGESGSDIEKVKKHGPPMLITQGKQFPCIVISPQAASSGLGWEPELLMKLIQDVKKKHRVDNDRVYLTGLSMGGYGTWSLAMKYPNEFAAIVPICGGGDIEKIGQLRNMPVWCFHGGKDNVVSPKESIRLMETLKKINPGAKFTIYPEAGHDSWIEAYNSDSLYTWLFAQKKFRYTRISLSAEKLKQYTGGYSMKGRDTMDLIVDSGKLVNKQNPKAEIIPYQNGFYVSEGNGDIEVQFLAGKNGKIDRFVLYGREQIIFYRVR